MSDDDEHAENPPRGLANFVCWLVRHNDEHVEILRHVEHAVVFVQSDWKLSQKCRTFSRLPMSVPKQPRERVFILVKIGCFGTE